MNEIAIEMSIIVSYTALEKIIRPLYHLVHITDVLDVSKMGSINWKQYSLFCS